MLKPTRFQKALSYLTPVRLYCATGGEQNPVLELCYYRGQYQLATVDALYSDGDRYRPVNIACNHFGKKLDDVSNVLVLGTGLGSAVQVFAKHGYHPNFTLIDHDDTILQWAKAILESEGQQQISTVCSDAEEFMKEHTDRYDLLFVDIFKSRLVPDFVTSLEFLEQCKNALKGNGCFALNYIIQKNTNWKEIKMRIEKVFPNAHFIKDGVNTVITATI